MKVVISNKILQTELKKLSSIIRKNHVIAATSCVLLAIDKKKCVLRGTDLETTLVSVIDCISDDTFSVLVDYLDLSAMCDSCTENIEFIVDGNDISIKSGQTKFKIKSQGTDATYVSLPEDDYTVNIDVDGEFYYYVNKAFALKTKVADNVNFNMVCVDVDEKDVKVVGVDTIHAFIKTLPIKTGKSTTVMIPDGFVQSTRYFQDSTVYIGERFIKAEYGHTTVIGRLSEQKFVNYKTALTKTYEYNCFIKKEDILKALSTASFAVTQTNTTVVLTFLKEKIKITSNDNLYCKEVETQLPATHTVPVDKICFKAKELAQLISSVDSDDIELSIMHNDKPSYLRPKDDNSLFAILTPVSL